ncbi:MAG: FG-GAP repeat protein [Planctomycetes bacterium]|nr:FG-GAP repeat protein [Planctomycetota bacterium]
MIDSSIIFRTLALLVLAASLGAQTTVGSSTSASGGGLPAGSATDGLGFKMLALEDLNADGIPEYVISKHYDHDPAAGFGQGQGAIEVRDGASDAVIWKRYGPGASEYYGASLGLVDWLGSGFHEIAVYNRFAKTFDLLDAASGTLLATLTMPASVPTAYVGESMASGDLDGDGQEELLVSASPVPPNSFSNINQAGYVVIFSPTAAPVAITDPTDGFGSSIMVLHDLDGDGTRDFLVGARWFSPTGNVLFPNGLMRALSGATYAPLWHQIGSGAGSFMGNNFVSLPDQDGDGFADVGIPDYLTIDNLEVYSSATGAQIKVLTFPYGVAGPNGFATVPDIDGDGFPELAVTRGIYTTFASYPIKYGGYYLASLEDGHLVDEFQTVLLGLGWDFQLLAAPDSNGDGKSELLISRSGYAELVGCFQRFDLDPALAPLADGDPDHDLLLVDGSACLPSRRKSLAVGQPFSLGVDPVPDSLAPTDFIIWGLIGRPTTASAFSVQGGATFLFPPRVAAPSLPWLFCLVDSIGFDPAAAFPGYQAPWSIGAPFGLPMAIDVTLQGVTITGSDIEITNGVLLHVR